MDDLLARRNAKESPRSRLRDLGKGVQHCNDSAPAITIKHGRDNPLTAFAIVKLESCQKGVDYGYSHQLHAFWNSRGLR